MKLDEKVTLETLRPLIDNFWALSAAKIRAIEKNFDRRKGAPVFTVEGRYTARGWTEWTQGFQYGSALLQFEATGEEEFLEIGRKHTLSSMAVHLTHTGVHDHGFNNVSTYGNLLRLMVDGKIKHNEWERNFYQLALKVSGAVQANRWTALREGGFMYSFNGRHSLFVDTIRSCRILVLSHALGHRLLGENDVSANLFHRCVQHLLTTAKYSIYYGDGRDAYDVRGRTAHESIFNANDGSYRCPGSQQGYSPFSTWTRGLAWAMCGFAEQLEYLDSARQGEFDVPDKPTVMTQVLKPARATCDFYLDHTCRDGIPYWDTGAPALPEIPSAYDRVSDPYNDVEPVDSSAAAIAAQGLLRLGKFLSGKDAASALYTQAGLSIARTLFSDPYISTDPSHEGLILHSVYHRPNNWDHVPKGRKIPCGESSMWGDYHARELALLIQGMLRKEKYYTFYNCLG